MTQPQRSSAIKNRLHALPVSQVLRWSGAGVALLGATILLGWMTHWTALVQVSPGLPPMRFNAGLCFIACGLSALLLTSRHPRTAMLLGGIAACVGAVTLLEYLTGHALGIDELFAADYLTTASAFPGRMSPLSATCFSCIGAGLVFAGPRAGPAWRLAVTGLAACIVAMIATVALFGYVARIEAAYGWGAYTRMALPTALGFFLLSGALLAWAWDTARREHFNLARWLPITGSVTLMVMVASVSAVSLVQLKNSIYWRKHTYEVLISSQALLAHLVDSQRGMRGYVLTGQPAALATYQDGVHKLPQQLAELASLTQDNPVQRPRIATLSADLSQVIAYSHRLLDARKTQGLQAAIALESTGEGRIVVDRTRSDLEAFTDEEHHLLVARDAQAQDYFRNTANLMVTGSTLAAILLVLAHSLASREVNRRKRKEAELRLSKERFRRAFDDAPIGMCLVSLEGRLLKVNRAVCALLGFSESELLHTDFQSITLPEDLETDMALVRKVLSGEIPSYQLEKRYVHRDGSVVHTNLSVSLVRDRDNTPLYFVSQIENIAHRREVDRLKREFISTVSHELRTPLTSIRGSLGLVDAGVFGALPEKAQTMVRIAHQNSERLVRIINDILDIEKIESGKLELQMASVPIASFLHHALEVNQGYGQKYRVRFVLTDAPDQVQVRADADRLMQVLANLLSNAAKFSPADTEVHVRARLAGPRVRIEVEDRGTGIPEEFRGRVFEKFAQADSSSARKFDGTGLGLSITRQLVEAMGGTIGFTTVTGQGTTFQVELPHDGASLQRASEAGLSETASHRVLVYGDDAALARERKVIPRILHVEDDLDLSHVIEAALGGRAEVVSAATLQAAEECLRRERFSLVVLDLGLPDGNGLALLDRLKGAAAGPVPVVILSVTQVSRDVQQRVAAALVKSRLSEVDVVQTILSLVRPAAA